MGSMIEGVSLHPLRQISVPKGDLWHAFKYTDEGFAGFGEAYATQIEPHQVKGWKRHNRYVLNIVVLVGKVKFIIYDDRPDSPTKDLFQEVTLSPSENYQRLTVAPGLWMAFAGADPDKTSMLIDLIPEVHDPSESDKLELSSIPYDFNV